MSDDIMRGQAVFMRHGLTVRQQMSAETAAWILRNGAGVTVNDSRPDFISKRGLKLWWDSDKDRFVHAPLEADSL